MPNKFEDFLSHAGSFFKKIFSGAVKVAEIAEPIVDIAFPQVASLYNFTVQQAAMAEAAAGDASAGPQKLAAVTAAVLPYATAAMKNDGVPPPTSIQIEAY